MEVALLCHVGHCRNMWVPLHRKLDVVNNGLILHSYSTVLLLVVEFLSVHLPSIGVFYYYSKFGVL